MQPIYIDEQGTARFKGNPIIRRLLDKGGIDLNQIAMWSDITAEDYSQFMQLIGYSVSGYGDFDFAVNVERACATVEKLLAEQRPTGLTKRTDTPESKAFWGSAEEAAAEAREWPSWKRCEGSTQMSKKDKLINDLQTENATLKQVVGRLERAEEDMQDELDNANYDLEKNLLQTQKLLTEAAEAGSATFAQVLAYLSGDYPDEVAAKRCRLDLHSFIMYRNGDRWPTDRVEKLRIIRELIGKDPRVAELQDQLADARKALTSSEHAHKVTNAALQALALDYNNKDDAGRRFTSALLYARKVGSYTDSAAAERAGITKAQLIMYYNGEDTPNQCEQIRILQALLPNLQVNGYG